MAELKPRLRSTVQVHRQHFRGQMWHVVQDPGANQFFRLNEPAYRFVALLDGRRTVGEAWHIAIESLGDEAPTQGEVIQLLGQLYVSNLLMAELPPDAETMFNRYKKRVRREVQGYLMNLLFIRLPVLDPDRFLTSWAGIFGRLFTLPGFILWLALVGLGLYSLAGREKELFDSSNLIFHPSNLLWLYASMIVIKVLHEFGHAFACKRFGIITGTGGEVHVMGVMFLIFTPLPYVDASSAWAFRNKWHRALVNSAGMIVELGVASVAAMVWAATGAGTAHAIAYNMMFVASVSTILFNGNPLLRYDAYYILSDLTEIPNLWNRSKDYLYYLVKRWVWNVRHARNPAHTPGEKAWMFFYAIASFVYRTFIYVMILLFIYDRLPKELAVLAMVFGVAAGVTWFLVPTVKLLHYLGTSGELTRVRGRATLTSAIAVAAVAVGIGLIPAPDRSRIEGVVEPVQLSVVYTGEDGFVERFARSGTTGPSGEVVPLLVSSNPDLVSRRDRLAAERRRLEARRRLAQTKEIAAAQALTRQIESLDEQIAQVNRQIESLTVWLTDPKVTWVSWDVERLKGTWLKRGEKVGLTASLDNVLIRAVAGQGVAVNDADTSVEIRVMGRPDQMFTGTIVKVLEVGQDVLPSAALGYAAGGSTAVAKDDEKGLRALEHFTEVRIIPEANAAKRLLIGQRVVVRLSMPSKSIASQAWRAFLRVIQKRFM